MLGLERVRGDRGACGTYVAISAGGDLNCAIRTNGTLVCWGSNEHGQLSAPSGTFVAVSAAGLHTCGIRTDGTIACWGLSDPAPAGTFSAWSPNAT